MVPPRQMATSPNEVADIINERSAGDYAPATPPRPRRSPSPPRLHELTVDTSQDIDLLTHMRHANPSLPNSPGHIADPDRRHTANGGDGTSRGRDEELDMNGGMTPREGRDPIPRADDGQLSPNRASIIQTPNRSKLARLKNRSRGSSRGSVLGGPGGGERAAEEGTGATAGSRGAPPAVPPRKRTSTSASAASESARANRRRGEADTEAPKTPFEVGKYNGEGRREQSLAPPISAANLTAAMERAAGTDQSHPSLAMNNFTGSHGSAHLGDDRPIRPMGGVGTGYDPYAAAVEMQPPPQGLWRTQIEGQMHVMVAPAPRRPSQPPSSRSDTSPRATPTRHLQSSPPPQPTPPPRFGAREDDGVGKATKAAHSAGGTENGGAVESCSRSSSPRPTRANRRQQRGAGRRPPGSASLTNGHGSASGGGQGPDGGHSHQLALNTSSANDSSAETLDYLASEDIRPSAHPQQEMSKTLASLPTDDWPDIFLTLNSVRRLGLHHCDLVDKHSHALVRDVVKQVGNLRSAVAKNAILAIRDLWTGMGRALDVEVGVVVPVLLKRSSDTNGFLSTTADDTMRQVIHRATLTRTLGALVPCCATRHTGVRGRAAVYTLECVAEITDKMGAGLLPETALSRDLDKLLEALVAGLQDSNTEVRNSWKGTTMCLVDANVIDDQRLHTLVPATVYKRLVASIGDTHSQQMITGKGAGGSSGDGVRGGGGTGELGSRGRGGAEGSGGGTLTRRVPAPAPRSKRKIGMGQATDIMVSGTTPKGAPPPNRPNRPHNAGMKPTMAKTSPFSDMYSELPTIYRQLSSHDWRQRKAGLGQLNELVLEDAASLAACGKINQVVDQIADRLSDSNSKVSMQALQMLEGEIVPSVAEYVEPGTVNSLAQAVAQCMGSSNKATSTQAAETLRAMTDYLNPTTLTQPFATLAEHHSNGRVRIAMLHHLAQFVPEVYSSAKPGLLAKHIVPLAAKLSTEKKQDIQAANRTLIRALAMSMGDELHENMKAHVLSRPL